MARGLLAGLIVGFAVGWLVCELVRDEDPWRDGPLPTVPQAPIDGTAPTAELAGREPAEAAPATEETIDVGAIEIRVEEVREAGAWSDIHAALEELGRANTPEADRLLVQLLGDADVRFEGLMGVRFQEWLADSTVEGIPEAVRRRVAIDAENFGLEAKLVVRDWVRLLMSHGTEADLAWLREIGDADVEKMGYEAMMASGHRAALALARRIVDARYDAAPSHYRSGYSLRPAFRALAEKDPDWARTHLAEELDRLGTASVLSMPPWLALPLYMKTLPDAELEDGQERILGVFHYGLRADASCVRVAYEAARRLEEAGRDSAPLSEILAWPAEYVLDAAARGPAALPSPHLWQTALLLLRLPRPAWTERELQALEAAIPHTQEYERLRLLKAIEKARRR